MTPIENGIPRQLEKTGFAIVPGILTDEVTDSVLAAINREIEFNPERSGHAMRHLVQTVPEVGALAEEPAVRSLVSAVLGSDAFIVRSLFFDKTPGANWKVAWHQDLTVAVQERMEVPGFGTWSIKDGVPHVQPPAEILEQMLTLRLHLDDCGPTNGPLQVIPGSHVEGKLSAAQITEWRSRNQPVTCAVDRGGAMLMRPLILHASSAATMPQHRRVVHLEFAAKPLPSGLQWHRAVITTKYDVRPNPSNDRSPE